ncbi:MAG: BatA domain-containing protein [Phycisphaerae bacterium]|nr:BatA domain-containing protein [Phycisphaerae bacterium]
MTFTSIIFLFGTIAIAGPILAHLLARPRFKRIPFTMLRFLEIGQKEAQAKRNLRNFLILLLRCLIIALLAMLFAGPGINKTTEVEKKGEIHFLALDDSMSMAYADGDQNAIEQMQKLAQEYIEKTSLEDTIYIYALASGKKWDELDKSTATEIVKKIEPIAKKVNLSPCIAEIQTIQKELDTLVDVMIISDFTLQVQKQLVELSDSIEVKTFKSKIVSFDNPTSNAAVINACVDSIAKGNMTIKATIENLGQIEQKREIVAKVDGHIHARKNIRLAPGDSQNNQSQQTVLFEIPTQTNQSGAVCLPVEIGFSSPDGIKADDTYYLSVYLPEFKNVSVLIVGTDHRQLFLLQSALKTLKQKPGYENLLISTMLQNEFNVNALNQSDIVILGGINSVYSQHHQKLKNFLNQGGKLVSFLSDETNIQACTKLFNEGIIPAEPRQYISRQNFINTNSSALLYQPDNAHQSDTLGILTNSYLSRIITKSYFTCTLSPDGICLIEFAQDGGLLYSKEVGKGQSLLINTSIDDSMGTMMKSAGSVVFCRYIVGKQKQYEQFGYESGETVSLPASEFEIRNITTAPASWVQSPTGAKLEATINANKLWPVIDGEIGWVKALANPARYAGLNMPQGEGNVEPANPEQLNENLNRIFAANADSTNDKARIIKKGQYRPLYKWFAWALIVLIIAEAMVANRIKR